jgi:hypothetical protein
MLFKVLPNIISNEEFPEEPKTEFVDLAEGICLILYRITHTQACDGKRTFQSKRAA